jgi:FkbM family methyltransferase
LSSRNSEVAVRSPFPPDSESAAIEAAKSLLYIRPLVPYPGWKFDSAWSALDDATRRRRELWSYFHDRRAETPLEIEWYNGLRFNLYLGNDLSRQLFIGGCLEPNEFSFLDGLIRTGMFFVDAGANDGIYTLFAARRVGAEGRVLAFEPSSREFSRLKQNLALNGLANVSAFPVALAEQSGEADLAVAGYEHEGMNTLGAFIYDVELARTEHVKVRSLEEMVGEVGLKRVDVIKLDVEGAESRVLRGATETLRTFRPVLLFEVSEHALQQQGGSREALLHWIRSFDYILYCFDESTGRPALAEESGFSDNMIAAPRERAIAIDPETAACVHERKRKVFDFSPARACWNHRTVLAEAKDRLIALSRAVNRSNDLALFQFAQLMAAALEFDADLIIELGRGYGNSTCAFAEAANARSGLTRVLSVCTSNAWQKETAPKLRDIVPPSWFEPIDARVADILDFDFKTPISGASRVLLFWDAPGFDVAESVLGVIMPLLAPLAHLVILHDLSDTRYTSEDQLAYGDAGIWRCDDAPGTTLKLGIVDSAVEHSITAIDFTTRNRVTLNSADHDFRARLTAAEQSELRGTLGDLFSLQGHWFYFSLNERPGRYTFPCITKRRPAGNRKL